MTHTVTSEALEPFGVKARIGDPHNLTEADKAELRRLYALDGLIVIPDLDLTMDQQVDFCEIFGPVLRNSRENYLVSNKDAKGLLGDAELRFHHDVSYVPAPYIGGGLHALEVSDGVSGTKFASGFLAYENLPDRLRNAIEGRNLLQVRERTPDRRTKLVDLIPTDNCAVHAAIGHQTGSNRPYLFMDTSQTALIIGMSQPESDEILEEIFAHLYSAQNIYHHQWRKGDLVIWDNLALQHARDPVGNGIRTLQRVAIAQYAYWEQYPVDLPTFTELHTFKENA